MVPYPKDQRYLLAEPTLTHYVVADDGPTQERPDVYTAAASAQEPTTPTPRQFAEAFSGHRFAEAYAALAPDVRGLTVGAGEISGRQGSSTSARPRSPNWRRPTCSSCASP
jgi:hypothetical protein